MLFANYVYNKEWSFPLAVGASNCGPSCPLIKSIKKDKIFLYPNKKVFNKDVDL